MQLRNNLDFLPIKYRKKLWECGKNRAHKNDTDDQLISYFGSLHLFKN